MNNLRLLYQRFAVWQYKDQVERVYESLLKANIVTGTQDLLISSIALATGAVVLTRNRKNFCKVRGLLVEDWTQDVS